MTLIKFSEDPLNATDKKALVSLLDSEDVSANKFISILLRTQQISRSSLWRTVRKINELGLIICGSSGQKGIPLRFTTVGKSLALGFAVVEKLNKGPAFQNQQGKGGKI